MSRFHLIGPPGIHVEGPRWSTTAPPAAAVKPWTPPVSWMWVIWVLGCFLERSCLCVCVCLFFSGIGSDVCFSFSNSWTFWWYLEDIYIYYPIPGPPPTNYEHIIIYIGCRFLLVLGFASMLFDDDNIQYSKGAVNVFWCKTWSVIQSAQKHKDLNRAQESHLIRADYQRWAFLSFYISDIVVPAMGILFDQVHTYVYYLYIYIHKYVLYVV